MIERIKKYFSGKKDLTNENPMASNLLSLPMPAVRERVSDREAAFTNWCGISINARANAISNTRLFFQDENGDEIETIFSNLLDKPNFSYRLWDFLYLFEVNMCYLGNVYVWLPKFNTDSPQQMWILPSPSCMITYGVNGISKFEMITPKGIVELPPSEILHIKQMGFSPSMDERAVYLGQPNELNIAINAVFSDYEKMGYIERFMQRDGTPPFIVMDDKSLTETQGKQFISNLMSKLPKGYVVAATLDGGKRITELATDTNLIGGSVNDEIVKLITSAFRVSLPYITQENANYASAKQAYQAFFETAVEPRLKLFCEYINAYFWNNGLDKKYKLWYEDLKFVDEVLLNQQMEFGFINGIFDGNEYRENLGYTALTDEQIRQREQVNDTITSASANEQGTNQNNETSGNTDIKQDTEQI